MDKMFHRLLLLLLSGAALAACIRIPKPPKTAEGTPLTYRFDGGADMLSLFTLRASYVAADGRTKTEQIASLPWSRQVAVDGAFEARLDVEFRKKADFPRQASYAVGFAGGIDYTATRAAIPPPTA